MSKVRAGWNGQYTLTKHEFYTAYHYALQYSDWVKEYEDVTDGSKAITYDSDRVQTSPNPDGVENAAIRSSELHDKIRTVEDTVKAAAPELYPWLLTAVTTEGVTYKYLAGMEKPIPCGKDYYYLRRRRFYYMLSHKLP
ncbi:MAG: hypothetical protein MSH32_03610 [Lachnospiraceae bacterium]|nr:hypothetical protein [Lachnospiraceae bacterium]